MEGGQGGGANFDCTEVYRVSYILFFLSTIEAILIRIRPYGNSVKLGNMEGGQEGGAREIGRASCRERV